MAFLDFDGELLAPRYRAAEQAMALLARAARLVGGRAGGGRLLVQTRLPHHEVIQAALLADPSRLARAELARREALRLPPGHGHGGGERAGGTALVEAFGHPEGVDVLGPADGHWLLRAADHQVLCDALAGTVRPRRPGPRRSRPPPRLTPTGLACRTLRSRPPPMANSCRCEQSCSLDRSSRTGERPPSPPGEVLPV